MASKLFYYDTDKKVHNIPLKDINFSFNVTEDAYENTCVQVYENNNDFPIETFYKYPVYPKSSLIGVTAKTEEYELQCIVKEKKEAKQEYDNAVKNGDQAVLVSEENEEQYDIAIGNIKPHQTMTITMVYLCGLE